MSDLHSEVDRMLANKRGKRDWTAARAKVDEEGQCRACGTNSGLQAAHVIPRSRITRGGEDPRNIVPLCVGCHQAQHAGRLELLPVLHRDEQAYAVELVGLGEAYRRVTA
jgi:5-methylcytosine-specific restriction endonuclease McrA